MAIYGLDLQIVWIIWASETSWAHEDLCLYIGVARVLAIHRSSSIWRINLFYSHRPSWSYKVLFCLFCMIWSWVLSSTCRLETSERFCTSTIQHGRILVSRRPPQPFSTFSRWCGRLGHLAQKWDRPSSTVLLALGAQAHFVWQTHV